MNIHELDSYDLGDAVKFNDQLNPRIWGADEKMRPEVREQLLKIADDFREFLGIDVEVKDITVSGSNAAFTYTPHSDIDLHLVVDLPAADRNQVYRELFDAKKYAYNEQHDIQIGGYDVELYVQDANKPHHSQGIYSIMNNDWVSVPKRRRPDVDDISVKSKFEDLGHRIETAIKSQDYEKISAMAERIKDYRQAGLDAHGEFGPENLAFKMLRTQGLIKKLYDARNAAKDELLSLDERKKKKKKKTRYGFGGYWYPGYAYAGQDHPAGTEGGDGGGDGGGESVKEDAGMTWDGVNPTTDMFTSEDASATWDGVNPTTAMFTTETQDRTDEEILQDFIDFCVKELKIEDMPRVKLRRDPQWPQVHKTFGRYNDENKTLEVAWGQRHIMDVLRTVAHELTHKHQHEREGERMGPDAGETGSPYENEANARAGVLMRDYGRLHPEYFAVGQAHDLSADQLKENKKNKLYWTDLGDMSMESKMEVLEQFYTQGTLTENIKETDKEYFLQLDKYSVKPKKNHSYISALLMLVKDKVVQLEPIDRYTVLGKKGNQYIFQRKDKSTFLFPSEELRDISIYKAFFFDTKNQFDVFNSALTIKFGTELKESASGYIPTKRQARDPRYSMALTVDIKPGQVGKEANKLKLKTDSQGHPQIARANGLFEALMAEYRGLDEANIPSTTGKFVSPTGSTSSFKAGYDLNPARYQDYANKRGAMASPSVAADGVILFTAGRFVAAALRGDDRMRVWSMTRKQALAEVKSRYEMTDLDPWTFDQTPAGWRGLPTSARQADAIKSYIDAYVKNGQFAGAPEGAKTLRPYILYWHLGQVLTHMGKHGMAVGVMRQALDDGEPGWNAYVMATISFLRKDRRDFDHWAPLARGNEETIKRLTAGWGLPYKQAYAGQTAVKEDEDLDEVKMSPSALEKFATSPEAKGIRAGFEAELIFRDTQGSSDDIDPEPDYDYDERAYSIAQVIEFFTMDEYGYGLTDRQRNRLEEQLEETYMNWRDEQIISDFRNDAEDLIRDVLLEETPMSERIGLYLTDSMQRSDKEADRIIAAGADAPRFNTSKDQATYAVENPDYDAYLEAADAAELELEESVEYSVSRQDEYWDEALDTYRENYSGDDDSFFSDVGLRWMSDIANEYGLDWPVRNMDNQRGNGSRSWEDIGNELQSVVDMPVVVSDNYHSTRRRPDQWILEPDGSLDPDDKSEEAGLEIVSPPMPLLTAIEKLRQVTDWANDPRGGNAYTNSTTGLHMGVSLPRFTSEDADTDAGIDYVKLILFMGDKYVQQQFGRTANTYAASALGKLQQNIKGKRSDPAGVVELLRHGLTELAYRELQKGVGTSKYTSAHIQNGYIEFRSPGGDWLAKSDEEIGILENTMLRFARAMAIAGDPSAERQEYAKKLYKLVTQDNEQYADQLRLFSEFSAGTINREQLKKQWAEKTLDKDQPGRREKGEWTVIDLNTRRPILQPLYDETRAEAWERAKESGKLAPGGRYDVVPYNSGRWEIFSYDVDDDSKEQRLEIVDADNVNKAADLVYDKYNAENIPFKVRPYYGDVAVTPTAKLTPRAKLAKRIVEPKAPTQYNYDIVDQRTVELRVVDRFRAETPQEAERVYSAWLKSKDLPDDTANYGYRKSAQAADDQRDSVDIQRRLGVQDVDTDVAQNFEPRRQNYELVSDEDPDRVLHRMSNATADEVRAWIAQQEAGGMPPGFLRTRIVAESIGQHDDKQTQTALDMAAVDFNFKNWADVEMRGTEQAKTAIRRHAVTKLDLAQSKPFNMLGKSRSAIGKGVDQVDREFIDKQIQTARKLGDDVNENFADGKNPGRKGLSRRVGIPKKATLGQLEKIAKSSTGERRKMAQWQLNMRRGKAKKNK